MQYTELNPSNNNALDYLGGVTPTITSDNCKVAIARNKDWISPGLNKDFQTWAEHNHTVLNQSEFAPLETSRGRPCKDHYHVHPHGYGRYVL